ncbi:MAG: hypothetical protein SGI88_16025 [Candidatus Hydrogenedentes bacterium]|nr:hypothetical protein [Candidatus Hydrogenedentota bacterium]
MGDALDALLGELGLAYELHPDFIWVTSPDNMGKNNWADPVAPSGEVVLIEKLKLPMAMEFSDQHVVRSLLFVERYLKFDIRFDARAVPELAKRPPNSQPAYFVIDKGIRKSTGFFPHIKMDMVPLSEILKALLIPMDLTYTYGPGYLVITSPELAAATKYDEWNKQPFLDVEEPPVSTN